MIMTMKFYPTVRIDASESPLIGGAGGSRETQRTRKRCNRRLSSSTDTIGMAESDCAENCAVVSSDSGSSSNSAWE